MVRERARDLLESGTLRFDGWINAILGFGGVTDKTEATYFGTGVPKLSDAQLATMFATEHLSYKLVSLYPRLAFRLGYQVVVGDQKAETKVTKYLDQYRPAAHAQRGNIWSRLFGGSVTWLMSTASSPDTPRRPGEKIDALREVDRRYLTPFIGAGGLDFLGRPELYNVVPPEGGAGRVPYGQIHRSRLIFWPGALTDDRMRLTLGHWDLSVLQRCLDALAADGEIFKSTRHLMAEASVSALMIRGLYGMVTGGQKQALADRVQVTNMGRSVGRTMLLDAEKEDYKRYATSFAGIPDITDRGFERVASAGEIPVTVLLGRAPGGLQSTGQSDLQWFMNSVSAYQTTDLEEPTLQLTKALLDQDGSPVPAESLGDVGILWPNLWPSTEAERAKIYSDVANADAAYLDRQVLSSEEVATSRFGQDGYSIETQIDRELRDGTQPTLVTDPDGSTPPAEVTDPADPNAPTDPNAPPAAEKPADKAMNGAQIAGIQEVVRGVAAEEIPRDSGLAIVKAALGLDVTPEEIIGSAGAGFKPKEPPPPPAPFGGGPPGSPAEDDAPPPEKDPAKAPPEDNAGE